MRLLIFALAMAAGCTDAGEPPAPDREPLVRVVGKLGYPSLDEASGLARSSRDPDLLWAVNDDGGAVLYGLGIDGRRRGRVAIRKAGHRDWEDLAAFEIDGTPYLLVADIGDNDARRRDVTVYVVEEPNPDDGRIDIAWEFDFSYPDGPRDAEALAVDAHASRIFVLSKRDIPPRLYGLPLRPQGDGRVMAEFLDVVDSLPRPTPADINRAPLTDDWQWQPTSMAIAADSLSAVILTYTGIYYYSRAAGEEWPAVFRQVPMGLPLGRLRGEEAVTLSRDNRFAYVTTEGPGAPILRIDLRGVNQR